MIKRLSIDPRTRFVIVFSLTWCAVLFNSINFLAALLLVAVILSAIFGNGIAAITKRAKGIFAIFLFLTVIQSIFDNSGKPIADIMGVTIVTWGGLIKAACFFCRISVIVFSSFILMASTSREMIQALILIKLPYELAFMTSIGVSFLPTLAEDMRNSLRALQLRGVDLNKIPYFRRINIYIYLLQPVIKGIIIKSKELSMAMEMRAFRAFDKRSSYMVLTLTKTDYIIMAVTIVGLTASLTSYFLLS